MILAKFETTIQVNENEFRSVWVHKVFEENTRLKDVINWAKEKQFYESEQLDLRGLIINEI